MTIEVKDNEKIEVLTGLKNEIIERCNELEGMGVVCISHCKKISNNIDNTIKKERIAILNSEINKIKKGSV